MDSFLDEPTENSRNDGSRTLTISYILKETRGSGERDPPLQTRARLRGEKTRSDSPRWPE